MFLFVIVAVIIVLSVTVLMGLNWVVIVRRIAIGGIVFGLIGVIIGELINYNLNLAKESQISKSQAQVAVEEEYDDIESKDDLKMESLDFVNIDDNKSNVINEDSDKLAQIVKGISKE